MKTTGTSVLRNTLGIAMVGALALTACTSQEPAGFTDDEPATPSPTATAAPTEQSPATTTNDHDTQRDDVLVAEVADPVELDVCHEAEEIPGATVEWLGDVELPEQRINGLQSETLEVDGQQVERPGVPEIVIPERIGQAGCIIEYPAPGGCLPAVKISGAQLPGYRIPERALPEVQLPDGTVLEERTQPEIVEATIEVPGVSQDGVCQVEPDGAQDGQRVSSVTRSSITRTSITQSSNTNSSMVRSSATTESGDRVNGQRVSSYRINSTRINSARINSDRLNSYRIEGSDHTEYSQEDDSISYTTEGDVLFDSDDHQLRSDAETELQTIADDIADRDDDYSIRVEGHTDNLPSQEYADNDELSEDRAQSVADWLTDNTDVTSGEITAEGMGEDHPRSDNDTDEGRQQNRRVVITVTPDDYEPEIDYEADGSDE